uniref:Uncharacterized protein n=1 Tax=Anas platyrhynchos TaxID=8839 RepID=A0A8B9QU63_ANAPL
KLEKQRIREEKREERRRRELEKKRLREEEKRKRREEERRKRKEAEKQKKISEKEIRIKPYHTTHLKKVEVQGKLCVVSFDSFLLLLIAWIFFLFMHIHRSQNDSDKEQRDLERRFREKEPERQRYRLEDGRKHRAHYEFDKFVRRNEEELKWGKGYSQDRGKKGNHTYSFTVEAVDKLGKEDKCDDMASKKERIRNKAGVCLPQMILMVNARERTGAKMVPVAGRTLDLSLLASRNLDVPKSFQEVVIPVSLIPSLFSSQISCKR